MAENVMHDVSLRPTTGDDAAFALHVTEACMRVYAERAWGRWDAARAQAGFDPAFDEVIQLAGRDIGLIGVKRQPDGWVLDKFYLLPAYHNQGIGSHLLRRLIGAARAAEVALRLTVLEVNPARRLYERHGFVVTHTISPRHHMEWRGLGS
jgi:GNAT superfamily N-acetyltransferase